MTPSISGRTSASLLNQLKNPGDPAAWDRFVDRYGPWVYQWCKDRRLQQADVDDVTQSVLVRLLTAMRTFEYDPKKRFRAWLHTVTRNVWYDLCQERKTHAPGAGVSSLQKVIEDTSAADDLARRLDPVFDQEVLELAESRVRPRVEEQTWLAFELLARQGCCGEEVAVRLGMTANNAYVARNRVQGFLWEEIQRIEHGPVHREDES